MLNKALDVLKYTVRYTVYLCDYKIHTIPLLFSIIMTLILIYLGNWQIARLHVKTVLIAKIESSIANPAILLDQLNDHLMQDRNLDSKVQLTGRLLPEQSIFLYGMKSAATEKMDIIYYQYLNY